MKIRKSVIVMPFLFILAGCMVKHLDRGDIREQIDVFGVQLFSDRDYREINGVKADEEPCLRGYERSFDALDIVVGYGFDGKIRKITTRNRGTSMFGIHPGMTFSEGKERILRAGFNEDTSPYKYRSNRYSLLFLVDAGNTIFGLTLETQE